ncbi:MAG: type II toxin-antitoxin system RelE/ParE family toxin [Fimbriimonas sp.]
MEGDPRRPDRVVALADEALLDLANIDNTTATTWGEAQADRYTSFLTVEMRALAVAPETGRRIEGREEYRTYLARFSGSRWSHGHRILYREIEGGIEVIRILHSRMDLRRHVPKGGD